MTGASLCDVAVGFAANINVTVTRGSPKIDQPSLAQLESEIRRGYSQAGIQIHSMQSSVVKACGRDAFRLDTVSRFPGYPGLVRQSQVGIPAGGRVFCTTFSASQEEFPSLEPAFQQVLASMTVPNSSPLFDGIAGGALRGGIIGGIVGVVLWAINKSRKKQAPAPTPSDAAIQPPQPHDSDSNWPQIR